MKSLLRQVENGGHHYEALMFWCPGCEVSPGEGGLHLLPVSGDTVGARWDWDGDLEFPTLSPSILTRFTVGGQSETRCHSYLRAGRFEFLGDCTHALAGQTVPMPDLPDWVVDE